MNDFIDKNFYVTTYILGFITIALFDPSAITDNIKLFLLISPVIAPIIGAMVMLAFAFLYGILGFFSDFFYLFNKRFKIF